MEIDDLMREYEGAGPGASLLVVRDGKAVVRRSFGLANLEERIAASPSSNYRLASVTKQFTAAAVLILADDGRLSLEDSIRRWLPSLPPYAEAITIRHLLTHTSGLTDYEDLVPEGTTVQLRDADVLRLLEPEQGTYFAPGIAYRYSNSGYALLALIIERVSGRTYAAFLRERVFQPLGMANTVAFEEGVSTVANRAYGYSRKDGAWARDDQSLTSAVLGDGGIYSSIDDLARWDAALDRDPRLGPAFEPQTKTNDPEVQYGFGWRIRSDNVSHTGETRGFRNALVRDRANRITVILLTNRNEGEPYRIAVEILKRMR